MSVVTVLVAGNIESYPYAGRKTAPPPFAELSKLTRPSVKIMLVYLLKICVNLEKVQHTVLLYQRVICYHFRLTKKYEKHE